MKKTIITLLAVICLAIPSIAQNKGLFASFGVGANINLEGYQNACGASGVAPAISLGIGKWINSDLGVKLGYDGIRLKNNTFFKEGIGYHALTANVLWNASNTIEGEGSDRICDFVPYAFIGAAFGVGASFTAGAGLSFPFRINDVFSLVPDIKAALLQDSIYTEAYNGKNLLVESTLSLRYSF